MIGSDFKIAVRNIKRNKVASAISILGLGIGLGCIILLQALIIHETSFDKFIPDYKNVYKIMLDRYTNTPFPLAEEMKKDLPGVRDYFRFYQISGDIQLRNSKNELIKDRNFGFSDPSIYKILGIKLIAGLPANTTSEVALSEKAAKKYFGNTSPIGSILQVKLDNVFINLSVSGVYKNFPANSTLYPDFLANIKLSEKDFGDFVKSLGEFGGTITTTLTWDNLAFNTYVVLEKNTDTTLFTSKMVKYTQLFRSEESKKLKYHLQPVSEIYLKSAGYQFGNQQFRTGDSNELKYYWSISFLILLISVTNYIFLTRASTSDRLREMGTKKVLGASKNMLRKQIILESTLVTLMSLVPIAFVIEPGMKFINDTLNRTLTTDVFLNPVMWLTVIAIVILTGTVSGLFIGSGISRIPALLLLSGKTSEKTRTGKWNYSFLIFHFSLYSILVVCVLTVGKQIKYALTNYKGIDPKNILVSNLNTQALKSSFTAICSEMEKIPGVKSVAGTSFIPPFNNFLPISLANPAGEKVRFDGLIMGEGMTELLGIEVIDGSAFGAFQPPRMEALFNESAAIKYGMKPGDMYLGAFHVRGIVKDFHAHSHHSLIQPMVILQQNPAKMGAVVIKTDGTNDKTIIERLRELYNQIAPDEIFEVNILTDVVSSFYSGERNQAKLIGAFSLLAMVLAVMGLFGIAMISIARKTKEIGLRKVNGASVGEILYLINKDFIMWVLLSLIIAIPVSFYLATEWQKRFAYKTELSWWIFVAAGISAILIALLTVSWQSWRAATRNPVEALRYE